MCPCILDWACMNIWHYVHHKAHGSYISSLPCTELVQSPCLGFQRWVDMGWDASFILLKRIKVNILAISVQDGPPGEWTSTGIEGIKDGGARGPPRQPREFPWREHPRILGPVWTTVCTVLNGTQRLPCCSPARRTRWVRFSRAAIYIPQMYWLVVFCFIMYQWDTRLGASWIWWHIVTYHAYFFAYCAYHFTYLLTYFAYWVNDVLYIFCIFINILFYIFSCILWILSYFAILCNNMHIIDLKFAYYFTCSIACHAYRTFCILCILNIFICILHAFPPGSRAMSRAIHIMHILWHIKHIILHIYWNISHIGSMTYCAYSAYLSTYF